MSPKLRSEITAALVEGGYFFFVMLITRFMTDMIIVIIRNNCSYVTIIPPPFRREKCLPSFFEKEGLPPTVFLFALFVWYYNIFVRFCQYGFVVFRPVFALSVNSGRRSLQTIIQCIIHLHTNSLDFHIYTLNVLHNLYGYV